MFFEPTQKGISDFLGATSITCWLFAQFPQVIENYRLGLALPFLVNWLLGDFTNLIGCIFTDQLPFQTYLATYFTFVDLILIVQFWYYGRKHKHRLRHAHHHHRSLSHPNSRQGSQYLYQSANRTRPSTSRTRSGHSASAPYTPSTMTASLTGNGHLPRLATSKPDERVHFQESPVDFPSEPASNMNYNSDGSSHYSEPDTLPEMAESTTLSAKSDASSSTIGALQRGRTPFRPSTSASAPDVRVMGVEESTLGTNWRQMSGSRTRTITASSRDRPSQSRTRSVVFLSIWATIGFRTLCKRSTGSVEDLGASTAWNVLSTPSQVLDDPVIALQDMGFPPPPVDYSLLVGRVAAWLCVCFYLTSRMPQIWKNFRRRSVEGLSILLFAAAFMGNLFYVLSILSSPLVQEDEGYLFESVPFLLGSGGTLIFDLTIMGQACMYAGLSPKNREHSDYLSGEGSSGLLAGESVQSFHEGTEGNQDLESRSTASRA